MYLDGDGGGLEHKSGRIFLLFVCYLNGLLSGVLRNRIGLVLLCATILQELFWNVWILFLFVGEKKRHAFDVLHFLGFVAAEG